MCEWEGRSCAWPEKNCFHAAISIYMKSFNLYSYICSVFFCFTWFTFKAIPSLWIVVPPYLEPKQLSFSHHGNSSVTERGHFIALVSQAGKFSLGYISHRLSMPCNPCDFPDFCLLSQTEERTSFQWEMIGRLERRSWLQSKGWWDILAEFVR